MKKVLLFTLGLSVVLLSGTSCKKSCNIPEEDTFSGAIINEVNEQRVVIYPASGGFLSSYPNGLHVTAASSPGMQDLFEVSFDGGITRQSVDFTQYNIIGYPLTVKCDASIARDLTATPGASAVFTMEIEECDQGCDELRTIENYILVDDSISNYNIVYNLVQ